MNHNVYSFADQTSAASLKLHLLHRTFLCLCVVSFAVRPSVAWSQEDDGSDSPAEEGADESDSGDAAPSDTPPADGESSDEGAVEVGAADAAEEEGVPAEESGTATQDSSEDDSTVDDPPDPIDKTSVSTTEPRTVPAVSQDPKAVATETAQSAALVHSEHCAQVWGKKDALAADSMGAVVQEWQNVISVYEQTQTSYLLYWRAMLTECLGQDERAMVDFQAFIEHEDSRYSPSMVADAEWRLRRVLRKASGQGASGGVGAAVPAGAFARRPAAAASIGVGSGLLLASAVPTMVSILAWTSAEDTAERMHEDGPPDQGWSAEMEQINNALHGSRGGLALAVGLAVGGATSIIVGAVMNRGSRVRVAGGLAPRGLAGIQAELAVQW